MTQATRCHRGALVSVEGLNGVGKTYLTQLLISRWGSDPVPMVLEEFSARANPDAGHDLGRAILSTLFRAAHGDPFLRGGRPGAETLSLLAVKMHDYERVAHQLHTGQSVLEGRSLHSTAVYQALLAHTNDDDAHETAVTLLDLAARWRPLPDLTILIADDVETAIGRAEQRDRRTYTSEQRRLHHRAATLFRRLADDTADKFQILDRRTHGAHTLVALMRTAIDGLGPLACHSPVWRPTTDVSECPWHRTPQAAA